MPVDDRMRVPGHDWLYAIGDANGCALLTHMGKYEARVASLVIDGDETARVTQSGPRSPRVIFTDPQVAAVGMTEALAREAGLRGAHGRRSPPTPPPARASSAARPAARRSSSSTPRAASIVGATFVGFEVGEWLQAATIAVVNEVPIDAAVGLRAGVSDPQRGVAAPARGLRGGLSAPRLGLVEQAEHRLGVLAQTRRRPRRQPAALGERPAATRA